MTRKAIRQELKSGWEWDWTTGWRKVMHFNAGVGKYIKRRMSKRLRQDGRRECSNARNDTESAPQSD